MRILLVNDSLLKIGGAESHFWQLHDLLRENGFEVECFGVEAPENLPSWFSRWWSFKYAGQIRRKIAEFRPDVVHYHNIFRCLSPSVVYAARAQGIRTLMTVHDPNLLTYYLHRVLAGGTLRRIDGVVAQHFLPKGIVGAVLRLPLNLMQVLKCKLHTLLLKRSVDLFIFPSKILLKLHQHFLDFESVRLFQLPYFVDGKWIKAATDFAAKFQDDSTSKRVLFVGRLIKDKGAQVLLEAFADVVKSCSHSTPTLVLAGDGGERRALELLAGKLGILDYVQFLGTLPPDKVQVELAKACLVVIPSLWLENYPMVAVEAQVFSKPLIVSNIGGLPEVVAGYAQASIVEPGDKLALAQMIIKNLEVPPLKDAATPSLIDGQKYLEIYRSLLR